MSKSIYLRLSKLKSWLSIPETAKHLSVICDEEITEADVYKLVLDGHLKLSVNFLNYVKVRFGHIAQFDLDTFNGAAEEYHSDSNSDVIININCENNQITLIRLFNQYGSINNIWHLVMNYDGINEIERKYQKSTRSSTLKRTFCNGILVENSEGVICQLQDRCESPEPPHHMSYIPATELPTDSIFVILTETLIEFERLIGNNKNDKGAQPKPHGNEEVNAKKREEILGAALSVIINWPDECVNDKGKYEATKIAYAIDQHAHLFWTDANPPLSMEKIGREISKWIKKTGK